MNKVAVAIVHGVGVQDSNFAEPMARALLKRFADECGISASEASHRLVIEPVHWAPALADKQTRLWRKVSHGHDLDFVKLRKFMIDFVGDGIAYQPTPWSRGVYDEVHTKMAQSMKELSRSAGPSAPLCVISHSLGTVISSNYFYDLSKPDTLAAPVQAAMGDTPLERGETLALFYTMGSPLAIWALHHEDFGKPIPVPSPDLVTHHPGLVGEWVNYYDPDDVIGYPLGPLNDEYLTVVTADVEVNAGSPIASWNPLSHNGYWTDRDIIRPIGRALAQAWQDVN